MDEGIKIKKSEDAGSSPRANWKLPDWFRGVEPFWWWRSDASKGV